MSLLSKSWNLSSSTEWQSNTLLVLSAQRLNALHCTCGSVPDPTKEQELHPFMEERKEVINTTTRTLQEVTYLAYSSLRNTAGAPG
jgi:hypothetical protein